MTNLTFAGDSNFKSEGNIKDNILKIFIFYSILSFLIFTSFNFSGLRLFNSLNLTMSLVSGGVLPSDNLSDIISTNLQNYFNFFLSSIFTQLYLIFIIFSKKFNQGSQGGFIYFKPVFYINFIDLF